jgi:hypothetical protein
LPFGQHISVSTLVIIIIKFPCEIMFYKFMTGINIT